MEIDLDLSKEPKKLLKFKSSLPHSSSPLPREVEGLHIDAIADQPGLHLLPHLLDLKKGKEPKKLLKFKNSTVVLVIRTMPQTPPQTHTRTQPKTHPNTQTLSQTLPYSLKECLGFDTARHRAFPSKKKREDDGMLEARLLQESSGASMPQFVLGRILNLENFSL